MPDQAVVVVSGLPYSGKSYLLNQMLSNLPEFKDATCLSLDQVRQGLFGERQDSHITKTEHIFKNHALRYQILEKIVLGASMVVTEAVMLTRNDHQKPFVDLIAEANRYRSSIEIEASVRDETPAPQLFSSVHLRVILAYADAETIRLRATQGSSADRLAAASSVFDLLGARNAYIGFEFPDSSTYSPLYINTSASSDAATRVRLGEVRAFVLGGMIAEAVIENERREEEAQTAYERVKKMIEDIAR